MGGEEVTGGIIGEELNGRTINLTTTELHCSLVKDLGVLNKVNWDEKTRLVAGNKKKCRDNEKFIRST